MDPILAQSIAQARIRELIAEADAHRLARAVRRPEHRLTVLSRAVSALVRHLHARQQSQPAASR